MYPCCGTPVTKKGTVYYPFFWLRIAHGYKISISEWMNTKAETKWKIIQNNSSKQFPHITCVA